MDDRCITVIAGMCAVYYGIQSLRILPTVVHLVRALGAHQIIWLGPPTCDPNPRVRQADQIIRRPTQYLFPCFLKHALGVLAAFLLSTMLALNVYFSWFVPLPGKKLIAFGLPLGAVMIGGRLYLRRALFNMRMIEALLSK